MKSVNKIFIYAFIILSLLPLFEFFLFQWRNDNRINIQSTASIRIIYFGSVPAEQFIVYNLPTEINSFTDYIVTEYTYGIIENNTVNLQGLAKYIALPMAKITQRMSNTNATGSFLINIVSISLLLARSVYIACLLLLTYIIILPVLLINHTFRRRYEK